MLYLSILMVTLIQHAASQTDLCEPNPCGGSGICIDAGETYFCVCSGETVATPCVDPTSTTAMTMSDLMTIMTTADSSAVIPTSTSMSAESTTIQSASTIFFAELTSSGDMTAIPTTNVLTLFSTTATSTPVELTTVIISTALLSPTSTTLSASMGTSPSVSSTPISNTSGIPILTTLGMQSTSITISPTPTPSGSPPFLELLSPQPIRIYGRGLGTFSIQINATVTNQLGLSVQANSSLLNASLISTNGTINVKISSYDTDSGQLVLIPPLEFYDTYVNATFNTSYFEVTLASPTSSLTASITFSPEYLDILDVSTENGRLTYVIGESLSMTCITIPPNTPVIWEISDGNGFAEVSDPRVQYDPPLIQTTLRLENLMLNDTGTYQCRGTGGLANEIADGTINVLPDSLTIQVSYSLGEVSSSVYLINRSAFVLPSSLGQNGAFLLFCIGLLDDTDTEIITDTVNSTVGFSNNVYAVLGQQLDNSGDYTAISFFQFPYSYSGNYTCRSSTSGSERTVLISNNQFGALAVLLSPSTQRIAAGEDAVFIYRIALADNLNVVDNIEISIINSEVSAAELSTITEQGNDIYHVTFPNVNVVLNQAEFVLQFNEATISTTATIAVLSTNVLVMPDQFAVSSVGDNVTLACTPGGTSVSIDWYRGDQLLTASSKYIFSPTIQRHMLTITDVQLNDANCYYCTLADSETRDDLKIELIVIEDPIVMTLNDVQLPPVAVVNFQPPSTVTMMCAGTERFTMASTVSTLPNPVVPGFYSESDGGTTFSVTAFNNLIVLTVSNINDLPSTVISINCTSLESSAVVKVFFTNENLFVVSLVEEMAVLYGESFSMLYTVASSSNGTDNVVNETIDFNIEFENSMFGEPINLNSSLLSVVSGNHYQLNIPSATSFTAGDYRLIAEASGGEVSASATVSVTTILPTISVVETVYELAGRLARLECTLSFPGSSVTPNVPAVMWFRFDGEGYTDASQLDSAQFESDGSRYTLLFESVSMNDASTYICAIVENEMRIVEDYTELIVFKNEINVGYDENRLIPSGAIINQFSMFDRTQRSVVKAKRNALPTTPTGALTLDCFAVTGQENPYWEVSDNVLFNGTILSNLTLQTEDTQATISVVPVSTYITVISFDVFPVQLSGTYTCKSSPNGVASSVFITTRSPFIRSLIASPLEVSQCKLFSLLFQVAQSSDGTSGSNAIESVQIELFRNGMSVDNSTVSPNQQLVEARFTASSSQLGRYYAYLPEEPNVRDSVELVILYPSATLLNDRNVFSLSGSNVTLGCIPFDQNQQIRWVLYQDDGTRVVLSPSRRIESKRLAIQDNLLIFEPPRLYHQLTIINASFDNSGNYSCEILPTCSDPFVVAYNMTVTIVPEEVNIGYDDNTFLPSGTIINDFIPLRDTDSPVPPTTPPPSRRRRHTKQKKNVQPDDSFQLECITVMGQENPYWEVSNNMLYNGIITPNLTLPIGELPAMIFIINSSTYNTIINFGSMFYPQLSGNYTCRSMPNGPSSSVILTTQNPFTRILTSPPSNVFQCKVASIVFHAILNSDGLINPVNTVMLELFQNGQNVVNSSYSLLELQLSLQTFQINVIASSFSDGVYYLYLPIDPSQRDSFEISVQYPTLSQINEESITVLRGGVVTLECIPSDETLSVRWIFYSSDGNIMRISPSFPDDSDRLSKRQTSYDFDIEIGPPRLYHQLIIYDVPLIATGNFSCEIIPPCPDNIVIAQNTSLTVEPACDEVFEVFLWPKMPTSGMVMFRCADIHPSFRFGPYVTRRCGKGQRWDPIDFTQCTVRSDSSPLLAVSVILRESGRIMATPNPTVIENQIRSDTGFTGSVMVTVQFEEGPDEYLVYILIELPSESINMTELLVLQDYFNSPAPYGNVTRSSAATLTVFNPSDVCYCDASSAVSDGDSEIYSPSLLDIVDVCIGPAVPPCICNTTICRCNNPAYSGNGTVCARDSDEDTLPDVDLGCDEIYCEEDLCPLMQSLLPDGTQDASVCQPATPEEPSCPEDRDEYSIIWPASLIDTSVTLTCPSGTGSATRLCDNSGSWDSPNVGACQSYEYIVIAEEAQALSTVAPEQMAEVSAGIADSLVTVTEPVENTSALPLDLGTTVDILDSIISTANTSGAIEQEEFVNDVIQVYSNILSTNNTPGWMDLQEINRTQSQLLLLNAEEFSIQWASTFNVSQNRTIAADNIVISAEAVDVSDDEVVISDVTWPTPEIAEQAELFKSTVPFASVTIPGDLVQRRGMASVNRVALIANTAYRNIASILPTSVNINNPRGVTEAVSLILSSQVTPVGSSTSVPPSNDDPVVLMFEYSKDNSDTNLRCGFWDFELDQGSDVAPGGWSSIGLSVESVDNQRITCSSNHLTSFAVLVDVSGSSQDVSEEQRVALSAVTYIGASISLVCLSLAIILFIVYRNSLLKGLHNFIHLNLTIALALGLLVFVIGIETATGSDGGCVFVAFLLHYFFTTVFTWMLCEGIMLYFLLVKVFNTGLGQRKLFYLAIGWGIPVPIVVISVGIAHDQYGTDDYCWISTDEGAIWAFVVPMLVIIIANLCILGLVLHAIYKSKQSKISAENFSKVDVAKAIVKATLVLLPLLGITWIFGILAVNEESVAFAWIFTILNSFQGVFIFALHVLRNEKIKTKIKSYFGGKGKYSLSTSRDSSTTTGTRFKTTRSNKGFTTKVTVRIDEDVELGSKNPLDDSMVEPNMSVVPEMVEAAVNPNDETTRNDENADETKDTFM